MGGEVAYHLDSEVGEGLGPGASFPLVTALDGAVVVYLKVGKQDLEEASPEHQVEASCLAMRAAVVQRTNSPGYVLVAVLEAETGVVGVAVVVKSFHSNLGSTCLLAD